jgi:hypothetical protein
VVHVDNGAQIHRRPGLAVGPRATDVLACRDTAALEGATVGVAFFECGGSDFGSRKGGREEDEKTSRRSKNACFKLNGGESCYEVDMDGLSCFLYTGFCRPQVPHFWWSLISSYIYCAAGSPELKERQSRVNIVEWQQPAGVQRNSNKSSPQSCL